jgi:hypothetical protein
MSRLERFRTAFAAAVVVGPTPSAASILAVAPQSRLHIYRNHYLVTLEAALASTFPAVAAVVGRAYFAQAARRFVAAHPPSGPCLHEYGGDFPRFLGDLPDADRLPYLSDLASLEWAINLAYHAPDRPAMSPDRLRSIAAGRCRDLVFATHPSLRLVASRYPLTEIYWATLPDCPPDHRVDIGAGGETVLVIREDDGVSFRRLGGAERLFLGHLSGGVSVVRAAAAAEREDPDFDLAAALGGLLEAGALVDCRAVSPHRLQGAHP